MADLPSIAQRLNDIEINNNAPVSSQTFRRKGSTINYILDFLGINNGSTLSGPNSGLNIFSAPQSFSYSFTFTNANAGQTINLFTFQGGGNRPLYFFRRSNNFTDTVDSLDLFPSALNRPPDAFQYPIFYLLSFLAANTNGVGASGTPVFIVYCNGIEMGRTVKGQPTQYSKEITHSPAGTNTVSVLMAQALVSGTVPVSNSLEYVAL